MAKQLLAGLRALFARGKDAPTDMAAKPAHMYYPIYTTDTDALSTADDLLADKGCAVYREMLDRDDFVQACIGFIVAARLSSGWEVHPASDDPEDEKPAEFVKYVFDHLQESSVTRLIMDGLDALAIGFSCIEKIMGEPYKVGDFAGLQGYRTFRTVPQETITIRLDEFGEIEPDGIWQSKPHQVSPGLAPEYFNHLPRDRFVLWSYKRRWGNPLGMSLLRPAYRYYFTKREMLLAWAKYMERFGRPRIVAEVPEGTDLTDVVGVLRRYQSELAMAHFNTWKITITEPTTTPTINYDTIVAMCNKGIAHSLFTPATLIDQTDVGSYSLGKEHKGTYLWFLQNLGELLEDEFMGEQVIAPLIAHNFGPQYECPRFRFKTYSEPDRLIISQVIANLKSANVPLGLQQIYKEMGWPKPDVDDQIVGGGTGEENQGVPEDEREEAEEIDDLISRALREKGQQETAEAIRGNGRR